MDRKAAIRMSSQEIAPKPLPKIALVGRPNVGKSTLFNRLVGRPDALVDATPGLTRDRKESSASLAGYPLILIDTAGFEHQEKGSLEASMWQQTEKAIKEAAAVLFLIDGITGITPQDEDIARYLRRHKTPIICVVNKADTKQAKNTVLEAFKLGFDTPIELSAAHGWGLGDIFNAIEPYLPKRVPENDADDAVEKNTDILQMAVIGRPNVGKSSLINTLIKEERLLVGPEAGVTRDSIKLAWTYKDTPFELIDTAGLRKKSKVNEHLETLSVAQTRTSIQYAPLVLVLLDVTRALEKQDLSIVHDVYKEGRCLIIGLNKWDLVQPAQQQAYLKSFQEQIDLMLPQAEGVPFVTLSALKGTGIKRLFDTCLELYTVWNKRLPTAKLNEWLEGCLYRHQPPLINGRRLKIRYMTQKKSRPPTFMLFTNIKKDFPESYLRYLQRRLRQDFDMPGVPLRFILKKGENPYHKSKN